MQAAVSPLCFWIIQLLTRMCLHCKAGKTEKATHFLHAHQIKYLDSAFTKRWQHDEGMWSLKVGGGEQDKLLRANGQSNFNIKRTDPHKHMHTGRKKILHSFLILVKSSGGIYNAGEFTMPQRSQSSLGLAINLGRLPWSRHTSSGFWVSMSHFSNQVMILSII